MGVVLDAIIHNKDGQISGIPTIKLLCTREKPLPAYVKLSCLEDGGCGKRQKIYMLVYQINVFYIKTLLYSSEMFRNALGKLGRKALYILFEQTCCQLNNYSVIILPNWIERNCIAVNLVTPCKRMRPLAKECSLSRKALTNIANDVLQTSVGGPWVQIAKRHMVKRHAMIRPHGNLRRTTYVIC